MKFRDLTAEVGLFMRVFAVPRIGKLRVTLLSGTVSARSMKETVLPEIMHEYSGSARRGRSSGDKFRRDRMNFWPNTGEIRHEN